jgi:hypothetical protein
MKMRDLGAVLVATEQTDGSAGGFVQRANPLLLHILDSPNLRIGDEEATDIAGEIIGTSRCEKAIIEMPQGQDALLPLSKKEDCHA